MLTIMTNTFTVLNSCDDEILETIAHECDVRLGKSREEVRETLSVMKLKEQARAAIVEDNYKHHLQGKLDRLHSLEGENLELCTITNKDRGAIMN
jgi:FMN phosphatase YigB (HAD superfamily)